MAKKTQLQPGAWGGKRYGSFAGRTPVTTYSTVVRLRGYVSAGATPGSVKINLKTTGGESVIINVGSYVVTHKG